MTTDVTFIFAVFVGRQLVQNMLLNLVLPKWAKISFQIEKRQNWMPFLQGQYSKHLFQ